MEYKALSDTDSAVFSDGSDDADYEDLDIQSSNLELDASRARFYLVWAQWLLISTRISTMVYLFLNIRFLIFAWTLYVLLGRFFVMFPFALEAILSLLFAALGSQAFWLGRRTTFKRCTAAKFSAVGFYVVQIIWTIVLLVFSSRIFRELIIEKKPLDTVNTDWQWLWLLYRAFFALSVLSIITSIVLIVSIIGNWYCTFRTIAEYDGLRPKRSKLAKASYAITLVFYFLLSCAFLVMIGMAAGSLANLSGKFGGAHPSSPDAYSNCDPIDPTMCVYPFPSSFHMVRDNSTVTKYRVNIGSKSLPKTMDGGRIYPGFWNELDGFSTIAPMLFYLQDAVNHSFVPHNHIERYQNPDASTVILDYETGERVPHWTELDREDDSQPSIIIQPAVPLKHATRYIIVVRNIKNSKGKVMPATNGFSMLRNPVMGPYVDERRWKMYQTEILPKLVAYGFDVSEIQLAWDMITVSEQVNHARYEQMRQIASNWNPKLEIIADEKGDCSESTIGRTITAKLSTPRFLVPNNRRGSLLPRVGGKRASKVEVTGTTYTNVLIRVPCSLSETRDVATQVVQYGHGLFGSRAEVKSSWIGDYLHRKKMIFFASDWYGMSYFDKLTIVRIILSDMSSFAIIPETTLQGWANNVVAYKAMQSGVLFNYLKEQKISIDSNIPVSYYGISQGGVVGGGYAASSPFIQRAALGVPGSPFALLLSRSHDFDAFKSVFKLNMYNWRDIRLTLVLMQQLWDSGESAGWLEYMNQNPGVGVPKKQVLIQSAHGDAQVTILGARIMARAYNSTNLAPMVAPIFGLPNATGPVQSSAITEWAYDDVPPAPFRNVPPRAETDTHECIRREVEAQDQIYHFLTKGEVIQTCNGPCRKPRCTQGRKKRSFNLLPNPLN